METLLKADIFFFITSVAVLLLGAGLMVLIYFCIKLVRSITRVVDIVHEEAQLIKEDIDDARDTMRANAQVVGSIIGAVARTATGTPKKAKRKRNT